MRKIRKILALLSFFVFGVLTLAQTTPPTTTTFAITTSAISLPGNHQTTSGVLAGVSLTVTPNLSLEQTNFTSSDGKASGFYGGARYAFPKFSTWLNNLSPNLSGYDFRLSVSAAAGVDHYAPGAGFAAEQHTSFMAGPQLAYAVKGSATYGLVIDVRWLNLPRSGQKPNTWLVSAGPVFHF